MTTWQQRIDELKQFEREEGMPLPMYPWRIVELEDQGFIVDLCSGEVTRPDSFTPTPSGRAISHLLSHEQGVVAI